MNPLIPIGIFLAAVLLVVWVAYMNVQNRKTGDARRKAVYEAALKSGDRQAALQAGREYYKAMNGGTLTAQDELTIANDINMMA